MITRRQTSPYLILAVCACVSAILFYFSMPHGIGIWHDAFTYINCAENLLDGRGLASIDSRGEIQPLIHFPPFYPLALSGVSYVTRWPVMASAKVIASVNYGLTIFLIGYIIWRHSKNDLHNLLIVLLSLASPFLSNVFRLAMTETIFLPMMLTHIIFMDHYLSNQKKCFLIGCAVVTALSWLTRYAAIFLVASGVLELMCLQGKAWNKRIIDTLIFGGIAGGLYGAWALRNYLLGGPAGGRAVFYHPIRTENLRSAATTLVSWLSLVDAVLSVRLGISILVVGGITWMILTKGFKKKCSQTIFKMLMIGIVCYGLVLFISLTFFDASTRLDNRILAPLYVLLLLLVGVLLPDENESALHENTPLGLNSFFLIGFIALNAVFSWKESREVFMDGIGYESPRWEKSPTIEALKYLQPPGPIYSNHSYAINLWSPYASRWLPETRDWVNDQPINNFEEQIAVMQDIILDNKGMLVLFTPEEKWVFILMGKGLGSPLFCGDGYIYPGNNDIEPLPPQIKGICRLEQPF